MGCSAAKNVTIPIENGQTGQKSSTVPLDHDHLIKELDNANVNNVQTAANGVSFEIIFNENEPKDDTVIKKHPPKRILELQETQGTLVTLEKLQEKLDEAENRRQQILQQRVQSAKQRDDKNSKNYSNTLAEGMPNL